MSTTPEHESTFTLPDGDRWLSRRDAAEHCGVRSERTIDRWADEGRLTRYRADGLQSVRFRRSDLDALFKPAPAGSESPEASTVADPFAE